MRWGVESICT
ncbi:transposase, partial [Mycobacterium tuberculosis KT-0096]